MSNDVSNIGMDSLERCCCVVESIQSRRPWLEKKSAWKSFGTV